MAEEVSLSELKAFPYLLPVVEKMSEGQLIQPEEVKPYNGLGAFLGKFSDCETLVRIDEKNGEVWGKCTCLQYDEGRPCVHIASMFFHLRKSGSANAETKSELRSVGETPEEGKSRAINNIRRAKSQVTELEYAKLADDIDELLAVKEFVAGSTTLVYKIPTKDGEKFELSVHGWTQAMLYQAAELGDIEIEDVIFEERKGKVIAKAFVKAKIGNNYVRSIGIAEKASNQDFFYTTLASKAIRNALKRVISQKYVQKVIEEAEKAQLVIDLKSLDVREIKEVASP